LDKFTQLGAERIDGGASLKEIGPSAFMHNNLREVTFPQALLSIDAYAFAYPKNKFTISIGSSIQHIGENAFYKNVILNPNNV
jgi:hypothetical protein